MVIDDLANRRHDCDLLLDQNLASPGRNYRDLMPSAATILSDPNMLCYAQSSRNREHLVLEGERQTEVRRILISMGGIDKDNATAAVLTSICASEIPDDIQVTVVLEVVHHGLMT